MNAAAPKRAPKMGAEKISGLLADSPADLLPHGAAKLTIADTGPSKEGRKIPSRGRLLGRRVRLPVHTPNTIWLNLSRSSCPQIDVDEWSSDAASAPGNSEQLSRTDQRD
jgi:hypothetical protein